MKDPCKRMGIKEAVEKEWGKTDDEGRRRERRREGERDEVSRGKKKERDRWRK